MSVGSLTAPEVGEEALDPDAGAWDSIPSEGVPLVPVPIEAQLNAYVRAAWTGRDYGRSGPVELALARCGGRLLARLSWDGSAVPPGEFTDAAGLLLPREPGTASPVTMGTHAEPVSLWQWRDRLASQQGLPSAKYLVSTGPGVFRPDPAGGEVSARSSRAGARWSVVLAGPAEALATGSVGVAVWDGANAERAGIGAVCATWVEVTP
ncbi:MAG: DOMON domain-containing protein [Acidimicrobiales bacterium]